MISKLRRRLCHAILLLALVAPLSAAAPQRRKPKTAPPPQPQQVHEEYSAKIREYTTEKFFLTELVDHLPASDKVPSPDKVLGHVIGAPEKLTTTKDINRYMRELAATSPRVRVQGIGPIKAMTKSGPPTDSPGKILTISAPSSSACEISLAVAQPGMQPILRRLHRRVTSGLKIGLTTNSAPWAMYSGAVGASTTDPTPRMRGSFSWWESAA